MKPSVIVGIAAALIVNGSIGGSLAAGQQPATRTSPVQVLQERYTKRLEDAQMKINRATQQLEEINAQLHSITGRIENSPSTLHSAGSAMDDQKQNLELESVGAKARMEAIEKEIAAAAQRAKERAGDDAALNELAKVVVARQEQLNHDEQGYKTGVVDVSHVSQSKAALAEAMAQMVMEKERIVAANGGEEINNMHRELTQLRIAQAERDARLQWLQNRLSKFAGVERELNDLERSQIDKQRSQEEYIRLKDELDKLELESSK